MRLSYAHPLLLSIISVGPAAVQGAAMLQQCITLEDCITSFEMSCDDVLVTYDFAEPTDCCASLADTPEGGCSLTMVPVEGGGDCSYQSRYGACTAGDFLGDVGCVGNDLISYEIQFTAECPASDYVPKTSSLYEIVPLQLTLGGVATEWTPEAADEWASITAQYSETFFRSNPDLGYEDIISYIDIFNAETQVDLTTNLVTLFYMQVITWRSGDGESTADDLFAELYNSENGKQGYLTVLQASNNTALASTTGVADVQVLQLGGETDPPEMETDSPTFDEEMESGSPTMDMETGSPTMDMETDSPSAGEDYGLDMETTSPTTEEEVPGGAGGIASQTHETDDTEAPTPAPDTSVGVAVEAGPGEAITEAPALSSAPTTFVGFVTIGAVILTTVSSLVETM